MWLETDIIGYQCVCKDGYYKSGTTCLDINECAFDGKFNLKRVYIYFFGSFTISWIPFRIGIIF